MSEIEVEFREEHWPVDQTGTGNYSKSYCLTIDNGLTDREALEQINKKLHGRRVAISINKTSSKTIVATLQSSFWSRLFGLENGGYY